MSRVYDLHMNGDCNSFCPVCEWEDRQEAISDDEQERPLMTELKR